MASTEFEKVLRSYLYGESFWRDSYAYTLDSAVPSPEIQHFLSQIDQIQEGEKGKFASILQNCARSLQGRAYQVRYGGKTYRVDVTSKFRKEISSALNVYQGNLQGAKKAAREIVIALGNLTEILEEGIKTKFFNSDPNHKNKKGEIAHPNSEWIYVKDYGEDSDGTTFELLIELEFQHNKSQNRAYYATVKGAKGFESGMKRFNENVDLAGDVVIKLIEPSNKE